MPPDGDGTGERHYNGKLERPASVAPAPSTPAGGVGFLHRHPDPDRHRHRAAGRPCPAGQPADARDDRIELDRRGARLEERARPVRRHPFPRRRPGRRSAGARASASAMPADWPSGFYAAHISNDAGEDYIPFIVRPRQPQARRGVAGADLQLPGLWLLRPPGPRRRDRRARRRLGRAARDAGHEPAIRPVLLQPSFRRLRRVARHAVPPDAGHAAAAVRADGSGRGWIGHRALGGRQLHRPVPVHDRHGARRHHRPRPARRRRRRAGALSRGHRRAASGISLRAHDAGVRGLPRRRAAG